MCFFSATRNRIMSDLKGRRFYYVILLRVAKKTVVFYSILEGLKSRLCVRLFVKEGFHAFQRDKSTWFVCLLLFFNKRD